ncbi:MAG: peptide chain release factor N(5)-glutamine methyltransferase [Hydrogenophilaceae bacterium]|jgi:release factor glutamine methyltransferase|nr:peptide chain release factor N(5)-glutamine methyltransferase [Hydrogenophilaceae bacterium]
MDVLGLDRQSARMEVRLLLATLANKSPSWVMAHEQDVLAPHEENGFQDMLKRRLSGEPIAYILGHREFFGRVFSITPDVLIPRPETELLVELVLEKCRGRNTLDLLDLGTGSGCIAITLALNCPTAKVAAVDNSLKALEMARKNAQQLDAVVEFIHGNWFEPLTGRKFDMIVANPPYISPMDPHLRQGDVRFEPRNALVAREFGLAHIRSIVEQAKSHLKSEGLLVLEHGYDQSAQVRALMKKSGYAEVESRRDLSDIERVTLAKMSE